MHVTCVLSPVHHVMCTHPNSSCWSSSSFCKATLYADHQETVLFVKQVLDDVVIVPRELLRTCSKDRVMVLRSIA